MKALTIEQWNAAGFRVRRGQRSHTRNAKGEATFSRDQVIFAEDDPPLRQYVDDEGRDFTDAMDSLR